MRLKNKRVICLLLAFLCSFQAITYVQATTKTELQRQKQEAEEALDEINANLNNMKGEQNEINGEISIVNADLIQTIASVGLLEDEIEAKEIQIVQAQADYDEAKADEDAQYEAMKIRIKFMYEKGDVNYVELFIQASSFSDMLNKAEYIEKLYAYDRELLIKFQETKERVAALKEQLEIEQSELQASKDALVEEQEIMEEQLAELQAASADYAVQIVQAKQEAEIYKTKIATQTAQLAKIEEEERKAAEEARKKAEQQKKNSGNSSSVQAAGNATFDTSQIYAANGSTKGKDIAAYACSFIGNPYVPGGTSLTNGADCSGFTQSVYRNFGYSIPRNSYSQRSAGQEVSYADAQPGDLICYAGHVALYIGNGRIVHASSVKTGIKLGYATYKAILSVRRIV